MKKIETTYTIQLTATELETIRNALLAAAKLAEALRQRNDGEITEGAFSEKAQIEAYIVDEKACSALFRAAVEAGMVKL